MVDFRYVGLADVLMHSEHGLVSHQPDITKPVSEFLRVQDQRGRFLEVRAMECRLATEDESTEYRENQPKPGN